MDVHKPAPWHGWRELLKEFGIIVLGVLTALGAEQTVEWLHWRHRVHEAEASMTKELGEDNGAQAHARLSLGRCIEGKLDIIERGLLDEHRRWAPVAMAHISPPPFRTWDNDAWRAAVASGATSHMSTQAMYDWSAPYAVIPDMDQAAVREFNDWAPLANISLAGSAPSEVQRDRLLAAISNARRDNELLVQLSSNFIEAAAQIGVVTSDARKRQQLKHDLQTMPDCPGSPDSQVHQPSG